MWIVVCLAIVAIPIILGVLLGILVAVAAKAAGESQLSGFFTAMATACPANALASLLQFALPWLSPAIAAGAFARERERGTWDLLRSTTLGEPAIVLGKFLGTLALLWPGLLTLVLLTPFQVVWGISNVSGLGASLLSLPAMLEQTIEPIEIVTMISLAIAGQLQFWSRLLFHTSIGLFISALFHSSGAAIAVTYGAILTVRTLFWLFNAIAESLLLVFFFSQMTSATIPFLPLSLGVSAYTLVIFAAEIAATVALVGASIWYLQQV